MGTGTSVSPAVLEVVGPPPRSRSGWSWPGSTPRGPSTSTCCRASPGPAVSSRPSRTSAPWPTPPIPHCADGWSRACSPSSAAARPGAPLLRSGDGDESGPPLTVVLVDGWESLEESLAGLDHGATVDDLHRLLR